MNIKSAPVSLFVYIFLIQNLKCIKRLSQNPSKCLEHLINNISRVEINLNFIYDQKNFFNYFNISSCSTYTLININKDVLGNNKLPGPFILYFEKINLTSALSLIKTSNFWDIHQTAKTKIILIIQTSTDVNETFRIIWKHDLTNVMLVVLDDDIYLGNPYSSDAACGEKPIPYKSVCDPNLLKTYPKGSLNKCIIKFDFRSIQGFNGTRTGTVLTAIVTVLTKLLNFTMKPEEIEKNDTIIANFNDGILITVKLVNSLPLHSVLGLSDIVYRNPLVWIVPKAIKVANFKLILTIFNIYVWIFIMFVFIIEVIVWWLFPKVILAKVDDFWYIVLSVLLVFLRNSITKIPLLKTISFNLMVYSVFCTIIWTVFQANLIGYLTEPQYEREINSVEELIESNLAICGAEGLQVINNDLYKKVKHKLVQLKEYNRTENVKQIIKYRNVSTFLTKNSLTQLSKFMLDLKVIDYNTQLGSLSIGFAMKKGHYFMFNFNRLLRILFESGFFSKVVDDYFIKKNFKDSNVHIKLNLNHFLCAFVILIGGIFISTLIFLIEIIVVYIR